MPKAAKSATKPRSGKDSHLYTDDNPATTIHGTGFKDEAAAHRTLALINKRSLTYQFQTVNTMYHRAKHHPAMKKSLPGSANTQDMRAAMAIFRHWLDVTYPDSKSALRFEGFKPLLSKAVVEKYISQIDKSKEISASAREFAQMYATLPKGKRLANILVNPSKPTEADWERMRYDTLNDLASANKTSSASSWEAKELWQDDKSPTPLHLEMIAWAWSPVGASKLS